MSSVSTAKGSHCQETIKTIEVNGAMPNQLIGLSPTLRMRKATIPFSGSSNISFQIRALTVGITKNGATTITRVTDLPKKSWSYKIASRVPRPTVITSTQPTSRNVLRMAGPRLGSPSR